MSKASQLEAKYSCTIPTKVDCDLFCMMGTSLMNGYATSFLAQDSQLVAYYFPNGDQTHAQRYGTPAQGFDTPINNKGQFLYMNTAYNYNSGSSRFASDTVMAKELYSKYGWTRPQFYFHYEQNGASLIGGETSPDWTTGGTIYPLMISNLTRCVNILRSRGYNPMVSVMWGSGAATNTTATDYRDAINTLISGINAACFGFTVKYLWGKPTVQGAASASAYRSGVDLVMAMNSNVKAFDFDYIEVGGDNVHPTTLAVLDQGTLYAGYWSELYNGNIRPTVSNVQITGTIKSGQSIGVTYTYSDTESDLENTTIVADTLRLREGTGTRIEFYSADDNVGTNIDYMTLSRNKTETAAIGAPLIGKYIKVMVYPKAQTGSLHGYPVSSAWYGPVVA